MITRQVTNCIEISRRYLGFLQRRPDEVSTVGVNQLFSDLNQLLRVHPSLNHNEFVVKPLTTDSAVRMNGTDVIQVLLNLVINAFQAAVQPHTVEVFGQVLTQPLDLASLKDGPRDRSLNLEHFANHAPLVALYVRDNGPGIPPEVLPRIFQPYFTTKSARQGTGLGLNIVQRLIREARGVLHVHTEVGQGTTFTVYLPGALLAAK